MVAKQLSVLGELRSSVAKGQQAPSVEGSQAFLCCEKQRGRATAYFLFFVVLKH